MKTKTKSKKVNKSWLNDHVNDPYVKMAQKDGFRARAAYKLKEIDEELKLIRPGQVVVDLGASPGAWSQYVRRKLSPQGAAVGELNGAIIAIDLLPMEPIEGVQFLQGDFREADVLAQLGAPDRLVQLNGRDLFQYYRYDAKVGSLLLILINFSRVSVKSDDLFVIINHDGIVEEVIASKRTENLEFRFWPFGD